MSASASSDTRRRRIRRRWIAVPALASIGVASAVAWTVSAHASTLLRVDFESGKGSWSRSGGSWSLATDASRVLRQSKDSSDNARLFRGSKSWTRYTVTARVKARSLARPDSAVAVLAHARSSTSFDRVALLGSGQAQLQAVHSGRVTVLGTLTLGGTTGSWHTVRLQESGTKVSGWVDGRLVGTGASESGAGRIGLQTMFATADFDDVLVDTSTTSVPAPGPTSPAAPVTTAPAPAPAPTSSAGKPTSTAGKPTSTAGSTPPAPAPAPAPTSAVSGYASVHGSTTGGAGGRTVTVTSAAALASAAGANGAAVIRVNGRFSCSGDIAVASDKSIVGVGAHSGLTGCGLKLKSVRNVIVQNLTISRVKASSGTGDAIHVEKSDHIWIDHNDLSSDLSHGKDYYDGLIDITHAGDYITISWNYLHDHYKAVLIGHSDHNAAEDTGKLHVTLHHNYFRNINSRTPSLRFGTGHVYDNYFVNGSTGVHSRMGAQMLVQNNVFSQVKRPVQTNKDSSRPGYVNASGNDYGNGTATITMTGSFPLAPYGVALDPASAVVHLVTAGAGTGHLG